MNKHISLLGYDSYFNSGGGAIAAAVDFVYVAKYVDFAEQIQFAFKFLFFCSPCNYTKPTECTLGENNDWKAKHLSLR